MFRTDIGKNSRTILNHRNDLNLFPSMADLTDLSHAISFHILYPAGQL